MAHAIKDKQWLLDHGHRVVHVKAFDGYRAVDVASGLYLCSNCNDVLNQECRAPHDALCPCCRFGINARAFVEGMNKLDAAHA